LTVQVTPAFAPVIPAPVTVAVNVKVVVASTDAEIGEMVTVASPVIVTLAVAEIFGAAVGIALTMTGFCVGTVEGAT
jgi:hypothetical protein